MIRGKQELIKYRINRAHETLREADSLIENEFWNASVNRIYYACYYAVGALLLSKDLDISTHKGLRQLFGFHFIKTGLISKDYGKFFTDLFDKRQTGDYDDFITFNRDTTIMLLSTARQFIQVIEILLK